MNMPLSLGPPDAAPFLARVRGPFSYNEVGATAEAEMPAGYDHDHYRVKLGEGEATWRAAQQALRQWAQFPAPWTQVTPADAPIAVGTTVAVAARAFGLWWLNAARIVYVVHERDRFGFAYGTLAEHFECGEERFLIERVGDEVFYDIRVFSRPTRVLIRLGYPWARRLQRRFGRDSLASVKDAASRLSAG